MQIQYLKIDGFKALNDFVMEFSNQNTGDSLAVLIGENGAGKSTVLEVILRIFGGFYSQKIADEFRFNYEIRYTHSTKVVQIVRIEGVYTITVYENSVIIFNETGKIKAIKNKINRYELRIFPTRIITFYSGNNDKLLPITRTLENNYKKDWNSDIRNYLSFILGENPVLLESERVYKRYDKQFIHCDNDLVPIYLVSLLCNTDFSELDEVSTIFGISSTFKVVIEMDLKSWKILLNEEDRYDTDKLKNIIDFILDTDVGKERFMGLYYSTNNKIIVKDKLIWSLDNTFFHDISTTTVYKFLERLSVLFNAKIKVSINNIDLDSFSEGQRQLIKMFGMLSICKNEECLVFMDEPDAHMNPKWKYNMQDYIKRAISGAINTQVIVATHDPLVINGMESEYISIFQKSQMGIKVQRSEKDTFGMGIDGLLQSEYYGLKTSYDKETSNKYQKRQELYIRLINQEITDEEKVELRLLTKEIGALPVANNTIDFLYDDFIKVYKNSEYYLEDYLSKDEIDEREAYIKGVIADLYEG